LRFSHEFAAFRSRLYQVMTLQNSEAIDSEQNALRRNMLADRLHTHAFPHASPALKDLSHGR
jgi:hypothetical protein